VTIALRPDGASILLAGEADALVCSVASGWPPVKVSSSFSIVSGTCLRAPLLLTYGRTVAQFTIWHTTLILDQGQTGDYDAALPAAFKRRERRINYGIWLASYRA